jgi:hypothetical protein
MRSRLGGNRCTTSFEARGEEMMLDEVDYHIEHRQEIKKHVKTTSWHTSSHHFSAMDHNW